MKKTPSRNATQDWQRRLNVAMIIRHNARHQDDPKPLPLWITESPDNYPAMKRTSPETKTERIYVFDIDYRCDPLEEPHIYDTNSLSFKIHVQNPPKPDDNVSRVSEPPSPTLRKTSPTPLAPVKVTSTPIDADGIICIGDKTIWSRISKKQMMDTPSPPPPLQTAPVTRITNNEDTTYCPAPLPRDIYVIREFMQQDKDNDYIPLMSAITLKKKKRMLFCSSYPYNSTTSKLKR